MGIGSLKLESSIQVITKIRACYSCHHNLFLIVCGMALQGFSRRLFVFAFCSKYQFDAINLMFGLAAVLDASSDHTSSLTPTTRYSNTTDPHRLDNILKTGR